VKRGYLYRVRHPSGDPKKARVFVVVSRDALVKSQFSTVICAPVLTRGEGLTTQVAVGSPEGLKHASWITCDGLTSLEKAKLTDFIGSLSSSKRRELNRALRSALDLE
jgi:mRNA interferase MazF